MRNLAVVLGISVVCGWGLGLAAVYIIVTRFSDEGFIGGL